MKLALVACLSLLISGTAFASNSIHLEGTDAQELSAVEPVRARPAMITRAQAITQLKKIERKAKACFDKEMSQMGMDGCAGDKADAADALLNKVYREKMQTLDAKQQRELRLQERKFVQAKVKSENEIEAGGGSIAPMDASLADYDLTKAQILKLLK